MKKVVLSTLAGLLLTLTANQQANAAHINFYPEMPKAYSFGVDAFGQKFPQIIPSFGGLIVEVVSDFSLISNVGLLVHAEKFVNEGNVLIFNGPPVAIQNSFNGSLGSISNNISTVAYYIVNFDPVDFCQANLPGLWEIHFTGRPSAGLGITTTLDFIQATGAATESRWINCTD